MIGLSTCWLTEKPNLSGQEIVQDVVALKFEALELDYRISESTFREMHPLILKEELKVLSIHNFFPLPDRIPISKASGDLFLLSSLERAQRDGAINATIRSIEIAQNLGALAVILHLGRVDMEPEYHRFKVLFRHGMLNSPEGQSFLKAKVRERGGKRQPYLDSVLQSLDRLNREAEDRGILLGIENRFHYHEIPDFEEIGCIFEHFSGGSLRYWHDIGHAHIQEKLGFLESGALLRTYASMLVGVHIHDASGIDDHWAPGTGEIDFGALRRPIESAPIKILEVHRKSDKDQLLGGRRMLEKIGVL
jgi:sugar phosphate isomerase/epimerase